MDNIMEYQELNDLWSQAKKEHRRGRDGFAAEQALCDEMMAHPIAHGDSDVAHSWRAIALTQKSLSLFHAGDMPHALKAANRAVIEASAVFENGTPQLHDMPSPYFTLSRAYWMHSETSSKENIPLDAQRYMMAARRLAIKAGETEFKEALDSSMVRIYLDAGMTHEARQLAKIVYEHRAAKSDKRLATSELNYAEALFLDYNFDEAKQMAEKALARRTQDNAAAAAKGEPEFWSLHKIEECEKLVARIAARDLPEERDTTATTLSPKYLEVVQDDYGTPSAPQQSR